jgi:hypothetical protein
MAKIARKNALIFGGSLTAPDNIAVFGSLKAGSATYSLDLDAIQTTAYLEGWASAVVNNDAPCLQDMNALFYALSYQIGYLLQTGIPEWNTDAVYYIGSMVRDTSGNIYSSRTDDNTGNVIYDAQSWKPIVLNGIYAVTGPTDTCDCTLSATFEADAGAGGNKTFTMTNMADGGVVNIVVNGATGNTVTFVCETPEYSALTVRKGSTYSNTMSNEISVFTLMRVGGYVYVTAIHGVA